MPKGLYCTAVFSSFFLSFFFFRRLISEITKRISTKLGHTITYDCYFKNVVLSDYKSPGRLLPTGLGQKPLFGTNFELWPKICLQRNIISTIRKNQQSTRIPRLRTWWTLVQKRLIKNDGRVSCHPIKFARKTSCMPTLFCETFRFNHIRQMAHMVDADAKSLVSAGEAARRAGSRWALPCI